MYNIGKEDLLDGDAELDAATIKAMLVKDTYTFAATETTIATAATHRVDGTTDQTLASITLTNGVFDAADITFGAVQSGFTAAGVVLYRLVTGDSDSIPIAFIDITDVATNGGDITVQWDNGANKIFALNG